MLPSYVLLPHHYRLQTVHRAACPPSCSFSSLATARREEAQPGVAGIWLGQQNEGVGGWVGGQRQGQKQGDNSVFRLMPMDDDVQLHVFGK